jgi:Uma2 family endonuclease
MDTIVKPMTQTEFLDWAQAQDGRYEFDGFRPVAVTGGTGGHGRIARNLMTQLTNKLRGSTCDYSDRDRLIPNPVIVFEVLSDSTRHIDLTLKLVAYAAVPTIKRYILIEQDAVAVTVYARQANEPWNTIVLLAGSTLSLPEIGIELLVIDLYDGVTFADPGPPG